jgi:hypothetical protein
MNVNKFGFLAQQNFWNFAKKNRMKFLKTLTRRNDFSKIYFSQSYINTSGNKFSMKYVPKKI